MSKSDRSSGEATAHLNLTEQAQASDGIRAAVSLRPDQLRQIGEEAARAAAMPFDDVSVTVENDASDEPAYFFAYSIPRMNNATGKTLGQLSRELRDRLLAMGDALSPYVRIISH